MTGKRSAVITGASRGIGRSVAQRFVNDGYEVLLVASNAQRLEAVVHELTGGAASVAQLLAVDLRQPQAAHLVRETVLAAYGRVDVLVNSAGATKGGPFLELDDDTWSDGFALKFFGAMRLCRALWPELSQSEGTIVNIVGGFSRTPSPDFMIAGSVNAALTNFSKALAGQGLRDNVNVNVVHPGTTVTDRLDEIVSTRSRIEGQSPATIRADLAQDENVRRLGEPSDVASLVAFLCSPEARHINGVAVAVDGGATRSVF